MHCYEIIPFWKAWLCFNPWFVGGGTFRLWAAALTKVSLTKLFEIHRWSW